jgi:hypothetical protein
MKLYQTERRRICDKEFESYTIKKVTLHPIEQSIERILARVKYLIHLLNVERLEVEQRNVARLNIEISSFERLNIEKLNVKKYPTSNC